MHHADPHSTAKHKTRIALLPIAIMSFMSTLDSSIVNVALPSMQKALGATANDIQWVASIYMLVCCITVLVFGRLGDLLGKARIFHIGVALFTAGSLLCGLSSTLPLLVLSRVVQGVGAAAALANNMGIATEVFPAHERGRVLGIVGTFVSLGLMCGPVLGGILVASLPWEAIFLVNVPVGIATLILGMTALPTKRTAPGTAGPIRLSVFKNGRFTLNLATMLLCYLAIGATEYILPFYLQNACGYPADVAGVLLTAIPLAMAVLGPLSGSLADRVGSTGPCLAGLIVYAAGIACAGMLPAGAGETRIYLTLLFMSLGMGLFQSPNNSLVMGSVQMGELGLAGSLVSLVRYAGMSAGVTGGTLLLYGRMSALAGEPVEGFTLGDTSLFMEGFRFTFWVFAALVSAGALLTAISAIIALRKTRLRTGRRA